MADMRYRRLGDSGLAVSVVGLGCNNFGRRIGPERVQEVVDTAIDCGVTLFDTADVYGEPHGASEEQLGAALRANGRRDDIVIATKFGATMEGVNGPDWNARGGRRYVRRAVDASLRRLGTDRIDLYQLHSPDRRTPIEETLAALDEVVRAGKVLYIGSSNFAGWQVANSAWVARTEHVTPFISAQNNYSWLDRSVEAELVSACSEFGVGLLPYFPLASGLLTGKYRRGQEPPAGTRLSSGRYANALAHARWDIIEALEAFAGSRSLSLLDVAVGGLAGKPAIASVIAGATSGEQVRANVAAGTWVPSADDLAELDKLSAS